MKIALLTDGIYPYVIGGMQKHSFYLAKYLARNKVHVDMYHCNQSEYDISRLDFFSEDEKNFIRSFIVEFPSPGSLPGHYIRESFEYSARIFNAFRKNAEVDFIYAKGFTAWKLLEEKSKGYPCAPVGVNFHGYEMFQRAPGFRSGLANVWLLRKPVLFNIRNADHVFSYGGKISDIIRGLGIEPQRIVEIPAGIEEGWLNEDIKVHAEPRKFIFLGRYERRKGVEELNKALRKLIGKLDFEFHFVGPIPEDKKIQSDQVTYHGVIMDPERTKQLLRSCEVLVCPSYAEGMPNVILEAMASGLAVIATDAGAVNLMVSVRNGILLGNLNVAKLSDSLVRMVKLRDEELLNMRRASVEIVRNNFIWSHLIPKAIGRINGLINP